MTEPNRDRYLSASQIDTALSCRRKWWWAYGPKKIKSPPTKSTALGEAGHKLAERTLKSKDIDSAFARLSKREDPPALLARKWIMMLPPEAIERGAKYEQNFRFLLWPGLRWYMTGKIDVYRPSSKLVRILDYKSTSDLKWAKEEHEAARNIQMLTYGMFAALTTSAEKFRLSLLYATTRAKTWRGMRSKDTTVTLSRSLVEKRFAGFEPVMLEMVDMKDHDRAKDIPPNYDHCDAYGGCFYRSRCAQLMFVPKKGTE